MTDFSIDILPCYCFIAGDDGLISDINEHLCNDLGYAKSDLLGKNIETIFPVATRIFYQTHFSPLLNLRGQAAEIYISLLTRGQQQLPVLFNASKTTTGSGTYFIYTGILVQNRKKFENELIDARKKSELALRENSGLMAAKRQLQLHIEKLDENLQFTRMQNEELKGLNHAINHELQEPIRKISLFTDMLARNASRDDPGSNSSLVEKLTVTAARLRAVVQGLEEYLQLDRLPRNIVAIDSGHLLEKVTARLNDQFPGIAIQLETEKIPFFQGDPEQVEWLYYELLLNAVQFRKEGNTVKIHITAVSFHQNQYREMPEEYKYKEYLKLSFRDEGIGFNPDFNEKVFDLFKKLGYTHGLGLGLSNCRKIIHNHNGQITAEGKPGIGTNIVVLFPIE